MPLAVKICGLRTPAAVEASVAGAAAFVGFVFFGKSPRHVSPRDVKALAALVPEGVIKVGLIVDASDSEIEAILRDAPLDMLQLHGAETPERVAAVKEKFRLPVMKAVAVSAAKDIVAARVFEAVADRLLFDAKPPKDADRPGGHGRAFDWALLAGQSFAVPWMLAGGLTPENVAQAATAGRAPAVDVSSGVEDAPGEKSIKKIKAFLEAARGIA
ncbi:MAG: phosphoribosylanthranilate isomerase [Rhodospirillales bacterium]